MKSLSDGFFSIDSINGFLPIKEPLRNLPSRYETLQQNTKYAKATVGTPTISWIPNQIKAVFSAIQNLSDQMKDSNQWVKSKWIESYLKKVELLNKQLKILSIDTFNPESVFKLNEEIGLEDF